MFGVGDLPLVVCAGGNFDARSRTAYVFHYSSIDEPQHGEAIGAAVAAFADFLLGYLNLRKCFIEWPHHSEIPTSLMADSEIEGRLLTHEHGQSDYVDLSILTRVDKRDG